MFPESDKLQVLSVLWENMILKGIMRNLLRENMIPKGIMRKYVIGMVDGKMKVEQQ